MGFEKIAPARRAGQLPPGTVTGMAVSADIAAPHPAIIAACWLGIELVVGYHSSRAAIWGVEPWGRSRWRRFALP
jgi:hypothetical protein